MKLINHLYSTTNADLNFRSTTTIFTNYFPSMITTVTISEMFAIINSNVADIEWLHQDNSNKRISVCLIYSH